VILLATFVTVHFGQWKASWHGNRTSEPQSGASVFSSVPVENEGVLAAFDADSGICLWTLSLDTPVGFAMNDQNIFIASMHGNRIAVLDQALELQHTFSHPLMNDLHSLSLWRDGILLSSSGVDAILYLSLSGAERWSWLATDHGFASTAHGHRRKVDRRLDFRTMGIPTANQTTHCNSACGWEHNGRPAILSTLFHQGTLVTIDWETGKVRTLVSGLNRPHSIRPCLEGWVVSDSGSGNAVLLDEEFWILDTIGDDFSWVQDSLALDADTLLIADANHNRLVFWGLDCGSAKGELAYPEEWKIYQVESVVGTWESRLRAARGDMKIRLAQD
jgi:hypothetical protein